MPSAAPSGRCRAPYTVKKVLTAIRPVAGSSYPIREDELWLFAQYSDGHASHPVKLEIVRQDLERETVVLSADLPPIRLHDLRHSYATLALKAGVHPKVVSERLGHATIGVTLDLYSHVAQGLDADAAELIAARISEGHDDVR